MSSSVWSCHSHDKSCLGYLVLSAQTKPIFVTSKVIFLHCLKVRLSIWVSTYSRHDTLIFVVIWSSVSPALPPLLCLSLASRFLASLPSFSCLHQDLHHLLLFFWKKNPWWKQILRMSFSGRQWYKSNFNVLLGKLSGNITGGLISSKEMLPNETCHRQQS